MLNSDKLTKGFVARDITHGENEFWVDTIAAIILGFLVGLWSPEHNFAAMRENADAVHDKLLTMVDDAEKLVDELKREDETSEV